MQDEIKLLAAPNRVVIAVADSVSASVLAVAYNSLLNQQSMRIQIELAKSWKAFDGQQSVKRRFLRLWWRWNQLEKTRLHTDTTIQAIT